MDSRQNEIDYSKFNLDMVEFVNNNNITSETNYLITTSLTNKYTYIFKKNGASWELLYKWQCTVGKPSTPTVTGTFRIEGRKPGFGTSAYSVKYATRIIGAYYYHSILYNQEGTEVIDGRLGMALSHGCVRLATENAKWIYNNIPNRTKVIIR